ncbi:hypothetical protein B0F90DRAFT_1011079 [Multifurca ochricompacta]|uniref:Uncharacterized protein n=1 Tax=Multifurca ochricompacta TaxID=376703 RepID=A0AAD4M1C9_9AGAM|nr:hypothetical protein B0F90DRAFT_1011079 [Multifurca ochricompacta]
MEKLLCATGVNDLTDAQIYAVLSQRLALDIDTPKYVSTPRNDVITREKLGEIMHDQIKFHMRICVSAEDGLDSLRGIALSEPILSRAACAIMEGGRLKFNLPVALGRAMSGFCLNRYARTRLFVAALFIWARDQDEPVKKRTDYLTVKELFEILFCDPIFESILEDMPSLCPQKVTPRPFREVFGEANMHFNHFIKPYEQEVLTRRCLVRFMARGAAGFSANEEAGFNAVYPYLYGGIDLDMKKIGFIMVQFKNDSNGEEYDIDESSRKWIRSNVACLTSQISKMDDSRSLLFVSSFRFLVVVTLAAWCGRHTNVDRAQMEKRCLLHMIMYAPESASTSSEQWRKVLEIGKCC